MNRPERKLTYRVELPGGQDRLRELVLYVSSRALDMPRWGKTKLNKILWDADFSSFLERGSPVSGRPYQKLKAGPAPIEMPFILAEMENDGLIDIEMVRAGDRVEHRIVAKVEASTRFFSPDDLHYVDRSIRRFWELTAAEASGESHGVAWKTREELDPLPYESAILSDEELRGRSLNRIRQLAQERGWKSE